MAGDARPAHGRSTVIHARIPDRDALYAIPPRRMEDYVRARGWTIEDEGHRAPFGSDPFTVRQWKAPETDLYTEPIRTACCRLGDWIIRCSENLEVLAEHESRSQLAIYRDI